MIKKFVKRREKVEKMKKTRKFSERKIIQKSKSVIVPNEKFMKIKEIYLRVKKPQNVKFCKIPPRFKKHEFLK
jgi:hypothetical protein